MKSIDNDIKTGNFKHVYLLYGKETYLLHQYRDKLKIALMGEGDAMNLTSFEGEGIVCDDVIDIAETMPFFADRRVVMLEGTGLMKPKKRKKSDNGGDGRSAESDAGAGGENGDADGEDGSRAGDAYGVGNSDTADNKGRKEAAGDARAAQLADYVVNMSDTVYMIFVEDEVDKRSRLYKAITKVGTAVEFVPPNAAVLAKWVGTRVRNDGKNITQGAYECFLDRTGTDMENIDRELEKLLCYTMDKDVIREDDVREIVTERTENRIFDMINAIAEGQQKKALDMYYDLIALKEAPMKILSLVERQYQTLLIVKAMSNQGFSNKEIAAKIGKQKQEWTISKQYLPQCRRLSIDSIKQAMRMGAEYEEAFKTGRMGEQLAVEMFIVDACRVRME